MTQVILVDHDDNPIGVGDKAATHQQGQLHRAFSVFVFNSAGQMLLQRRARHKYHSGGLWTNACCSHPRPGEATQAAAHRRLQEEMGFDCELEEVFQFTYRAELDNDLIEHEYDHVFVGAYDGDPIPNPAEVADWKWVDVETLLQGAETNPDRYTYWFKLILDRLVSQLQSVR